MSRLLEIVRNVVRQELAQQRGSLLGVVTQVLPHTDAEDDFNYEADVKLKQEDLELKNVPIAINHVGVATPPRVGDLVLVQCINGDLNQPVITGRFYHADERPPLHQEDDLVFEHRVPDGTLNHLRFSADGSIVLQRDVTKPEDNSEAKTSLKIDGGSGDLAIELGAIKLEIVNDTEIVITDKAGSSIEMKEDAFKLVAKADFTIDASGQAVEIIASTIDFNKG